MQAPTSVPLADNDLFVCLIDDRIPDQMDALNPLALRILEGNLDQIIFLRDQSAVTHLLTA